MNNSIFPCLWFDGNSKEAADFYCSIFKRSRILVDSELVTQFEIEGKKLMGLNGGPMFKITPAISLFVICETKEEIDTLFAKLSEGGMVMMGLDKYPWSERYGWTADKYGMTWQLMLGELKPGSQKISTSFLFVGDQFGKGKQAMEFYTSIFPNSSIGNFQLYGPGEAAAEGSLMFGEFNLNKEHFTAMDGAGEHKFTFGEGLSIMVECKDQKEIDHYWYKLSEGGEESRCGWLKDKFGVSWQVAPAILGELIKDKEKWPRVMQEVMKMGKLEIDKMVNA